MKFFFRKKDNTDEAKPREWIKLSGRPYNEYECRDVAIKIWLPEVVEGKIDEVCNCIDTTKSDFIRQILFVHLYGRADFLALVQMQHSSLYDQDSGVRFKKVPSDTPPPIIVGLKIWVPSKLKSDLDKLAISKKMSLSSYAREIITTHLFGHIPYDSDPYKIEPPKDFTED